MPSHGLDEEEKPCRACSDFKSWTKKQNQTKLTNKPHWSVDKQTIHLVFSKTVVYNILLHHKFDNSLQEVRHCPESSQGQPPKEKECPLDKEELGHATWGFLHSMAAYYPDKPTTSQAEHMSQFFNIFAQFYPCEPCALDFQEDIKKHPPKTKSRTALMKWLCERHNIVNAKLDKPLYDCSKMDERWRDGWKDGSCD